LGLSDKIFAFIDKSTALPHSHFASKDQKNRKENMVGTIKGSFSVSSSSTIIVAMLPSGAIRKGEIIACPLTDGTVRELTVRAVEAIVPTEPGAGSRCPVALIVESLKPAEAVIDGEIFIPGMPEESGSPSRSAGDPASHRRVS
jgi:hypothetical protein